MREFTLRAVLLGLIMTVILGAANAYLGLRAGMTIAATYPAAVISMAVLRLMRGSILEENLARTAGSIGESVAAGAIFTIPAFVIAQAWPSFGFGDAYWKSTALMVTGSVLGVLFVSLIRRVMVEDRELPFPESVAAAEIHKAGQRGSQAAKYLFYNMGLGAAVYFLGVLKLFAPERDFVMRIGDLGRSFVRLGGSEDAPRLATGGFSAIAAPAVSPAYLGVGYIIGPRLAALNFSGGVLAWGLMVPLLIYFLGPQLAPLAAEEAAWEGLSTQVWLRIVRPIAVGGMLVGAAYTLFRMRHNLSIGLGKAIAELRGMELPIAQRGRLDRYMSSKTVFAGIGVVFLLMIALYSYLADTVGAGLVAAIVMLVTGFFFATVSGYLVGVIGSSNNPVSGLTLSTLIIAALLMVALGMAGAGGVAAVLGVAAVVCVSSAVAGELLQDFKVGYILGGTPRTIQIVELIAVAVASAVMYFPLLVLHEGNIRAGGTGFGDRALPAPQAGLMASLAEGIMGGDMAWPLVGAGMLMGLAMILFQVRSPMLVAVGMYLPLSTTFAIFVGGVLRWATDSLAARRGLNEAQKARVENTGVLVASGLIAGEALVGLVTATFNFFETRLPSLFEQPSYLTGLAVMALLAFVMIRTPLSNAGRPDEPAPPSAIM
ncbi:MAG: oligopeptide transporter, OPT family [Bryobacterales bacterium]|nr:oligopeptide transporter, OPT family [Bryobacterales bacterium]